MRKLSAWLRSHPMVSILLTLVAFFTTTHFFLNWKAEQRWQAYVKEGRGRGVKFDLTEFAPPTIPDEENFAALPMMRAIMKPGAKSPMALPEGDRPSFGDPLKGERLDWEKWQTFFKDAGFISETTDSAPRDVLRALDHYAPQFQEWDGWKTRPRCRFDLDLKAAAAIPFSHLGMFHDAAKLFSLRGHANLSLGEPAAAYDDFRNGLQAYRAMLDEPTLISGLVKIASLQVIISEVGDGLLTHSWTETELRKIAGDLTEIRIWEDYRSAFASERGFGNNINDEYVAMSPWKRARKIGAIPALPGLSGPPIEFGFALLIPNRMFRDNQLRHNRYVDELLGRVSEEGTKYDPDSTTPSDADHLQQGLDEFWFALFKVSAPVFSFIGQKFAFVQTRLELARVAVALEQFRIGHGALPEKLTELVPDFIAALRDDIYTGKPMIYRRKDGGGFFLYSVGPNRTDDGGATGGKGTEQNQPDWVWPHSRD